MFGFVHSLFGFNGKQTDDNCLIKANSNHISDDEFSDADSDLVDEVSPRKPIKINDDFGLDDVIGDNKEETDLWNEEWNAFEDMITEENRQIFETNAKYLSLKGMVTNLFSDSEIIIDGEKHVKYDHCHITDLSIGDLVNIETNDNKEVTVKPLRYKILTAKITDYEKSFTRFIFSGHAFIRKSSLTANLRVGDVLKCVVIETNVSNHYTWRAYPYTQVCDPTATSGDKIDDYTNELMEDKNGIKILRQIDFQQMKIKSKKTIIVWIKNDGKTPQILESVDNEEGENQISFHAFHKTYGNVTGPPYVIPANREVFVELKCEAEYCGDHNELLIFKFESFKIGRYASVTVLNFNSDNQLARGNRCDTTHYRRRRFGDNTWIIPGEKLWPQNKHIFDKLERYSVPYKLWQTLENNWSLEDNFPEYKQLLDKNNYRKKFHTLLWLEELENTSNLNSYEMSGVTIRRDGRFFAINVPGLAEGRPSLITGDKVLIDEGVMNTDGKRIVFEGFIHELRKDEILVRFNEQLHKEYAVGTKFNVMFQMGRMVYRRCHHAVDLAPHMVEQVLFPTNVIIKAPLKRVPIDSINWFNPTLNVQQKLAVVGAIRGECRPTPYIIFGPPGTGKTVTIVESILQVFDKIPHSRIIACTAANSSADLIVQKLLDSGKITEKDLIRVTALHRVNSIPGSVQCVTQVADEDSKKWLYHRVIVTTSSQAGVVYRHKISSSHFTHVFIDEAAQVIEPESLIPISMSVIAHGVVVLAGDHQQLGPVVQSTKAKDGRLHRSLIERLMTCFSVYERNDSHKKYGYYNPKFVVKLVNNYRSDSQIMCLPSKMFYENELKFNTVTDHKLLLSVKLSSAINFHGVRGEDMQDPDCPSWYNPQEIIQVCSYLDRLYEAGVKPEDIGIITPYRKQVMRIRTHIHDMGLIECNVATIEEFQGLEKRVIIVSMVRSMAKNLDYDKKFNLGFIHNNKRFNVAISRAMNLLIIVGNPSILSRDKCWSELIDYCLEHNCYYGVQFKEFEPKRRATFRERFENAKKSVED